MKDTSPAPTKVMKLPDASMVATSVLLVLYVMTPLLLLVGCVIIANDASPNVLDVETENVDAENVDVPRCTVSGLLVMVALEYWAVSACEAVNITSPAPTNVIKFPDASMIATAVLLLLYVMAPLLLLVGRVKIANDASPNVLDDETENVDDENVDNGSSVFRIIPNP